MVAAPQESGETIVREMLQRVRSNNWESATLASVIRAGRVAFEPEFRSRANLERLREFYVREIEASTSRVFLGAFMSIYLSSYEPGSRHSESLAAALEVSHNRLGGRWQGLLSKVPYLLDSRNASRKIGSAMCKMDNPWYGLQAMGFHDPHAQGVLDCAHLAYVDGVSSALRREPDVQRMLDWLSPPGRDARVIGAKEAISALLRPWISEEPESGVRDHLVKGLVSSYGDPRVRRGGIWPQVHSDCRDVLLRWLTGENIRFFLDVVSEVETSHMWQPRREFWWGLYEGGRIDAAWVAFSPNAAYTARHLARQPDHLAYGEQTAGGSRKHTSLLILKIGNCIVVEGSHNYKVHVFKDSNRNAPRLFQKRYNCEEIRLAPGSKAQAHQGHWERRVRELIEYCY